MRYFYFLITAIILCSCQEETQYVKISGETMGTYYNVTCEIPTEHAAADVKAALDQLLIDINDEVSTYIPTSTISMFNQAEGSYAVESDKEHFIKNLESSLDYFELTDGYFDPTVMPLVNYWGFGYTPKRPVLQTDSLYIDSIMQYVGFESLDYKISDGHCEMKPFDGQLDFSAIAKGYAVDALSSLLTNQYESKNHMVEIGGEVALRGVNDRDKEWIIGINTPSEEAAITDVIEYLQLSGVGLASSGNYRIYHEVDGQKYGHTINPKTGYPEISSLLAVSVISPTCMESDALATACMVMGYPRAEELINNLDNVSACFFVGQADGSIEKIYSNGFIQYVAE